MLQAFLPPAASEEMFSEQICLAPVYTNMCLFVWDIVRQAFLQAIRSYFKAKASVGES